MGKLKKRSVKQNIIAIVYDFDGTLSPHNMQEETIFKDYGVRKDEIWQKADHLVASGYERTLAYLKLLIHDKAFKEHPLKRDRLRHLARHITYFPGVPTFFPMIERELEKMAGVTEWGISIEHYLVSSGMVEILEGTRIFKYFTKAYACEYEYGMSGPIFPKLVINDTNKTQFLFRINKGKLNLREDINSHMPEQQRRIPFRNMIYIGDSITDIPSMTVMQRYGGHAIAVFDPSRKLPRRVMEMVKEKKVDHFAPADYRKNALLVKIIRTVLRKIVSSIVYRGSAGMSFDWVQSADE
ncbi:MAG: HAD family hydrolase [Candidatus Omnitrophota bacterium]|nr:HAD family hydrolase [Candidatus Omnitrophota bacterium]